MWLVAVLQLVLRLCSRVETGLAAWALRLLAVRQQLCSIRSPLLFRWDLQLSCDLQPREENFFLLEAGIFKP